MQNGFLYIKSYSVLSVDPDGQDSTDDELQDAQSDEELGENKRRVPRVERKDADNCP